jgi:WD40 repeat protein
MAVVKLELRWQQTIPDHVIAINWATDGLTLAAAAVSGPIHVFDAASGNTKYICPGHGFGTTAMSWHPEGKIFATAGQDGKVRLWETATGNPLQVLEGGAAWVEHLAWSPKGDYLVSAAGKKLRLWSKDGTLVQSYPDAKNTITALVWAPYGREFATGNYGGVTFYRPDAAQAVNAFEWSGSVIALAWSPDGKMLAGGGQDATVHFWYIKSGEDLQMSGYPTKIRELSWDPTSRYLATGGGEAVVVWDCSGKGPAGSQPLAFELHQRTLSAVAFQRRGPRMVSGCPDGNIGLWQPGLSTKLLSSIEFSDGVSQLVWSPSDGRIAVGGENGAVGVLVL